MKKKATVFKFSSEKIRRAVNSTGLTLAQKAVLSEIAIKVDWKKDPTETPVFRRVGQIATVVGVSDRHVRRILGDLQSLGYMKVETVQRYCEAADCYVDAENKFTLTEMLFLNHERGVLNLKRKRLLGRRTPAEVIDVSAKIARLDEKIDSLIRETLESDFDRPQTLRGRFGNRIKTLKKQRAKIEEELHQAIESGSLAAISAAKKRRDRINKAFENIKKYQKNVRTPLTPESVPTDIQDRTHGHRRPTPRTPESDILNTPPNDLSKSISNSHSGKKSQKGLSEIFRRMVEMDLFGRTVRAEKREPEPERSQMSIARKVLLICGQDEAEKERIFRELEESVRLIETIPALQDPPQKGQHTLGRLLYLQDLKDIAYGGVQASFAAEAKKVGVLRLAKVRGWDPALTVRWLTDSKAADEEIYDAFEREFGQKVRKIPGDQAEQTGDASGTGFAEAPAETCEENQPAPEAITPAPADFGWEPEYEDDCPTAGELNAVFCNEPEGGIPEEQTEAPEASGDTQAPPVTPTTTEAAFTGSGTEAPGSVEPPSAIAQEEKEMAEVSGQGKSSADDFQERARALLDRAENLTGPARQKIWDQAMALRKERDEAKKQAKTGAPPPALPSEKQGPDTTGGVGEKSATEATKVQQFSVNDPRGFDMPEFVSSPLPEEMGRGLRNHGTNGLKKATTFSDAALDDFIFGDSGESALESGVWLDKKGVPSPEKPSSTLCARNGTVADGISDKQEVQPTEVHAAQDFEIPEDLNSSPPANQDGEPIHQTYVTPEQSNTEFDAQLDEFILAGLGEAGPEAGGLMGSGPEKTGNDFHESSESADSTTGSTVVEKQRPDTSYGSGPARLDLMETQSNCTLDRSESGSAPRPSGVSETSRGARAVLHRDLSGNSQKMPARTESGPEKQRPEAAIDSGLATHFSELFTSADSNISESAGQGWGYTGEENQRPEAQVESGPDSAMKFQDNDNSTIPQNLAGPADLSDPVEQAINLALGTAGSPAEQKKSVAGRKNIPAEQNADPAQERSVSAGKKKNSGNVAVRDSGKRELTPPSTESTDGGNHSATTPEQISTRRYSEEVGLLPGETVDEYVKRACRVCFRGKLAQQFQNCERIRKLPCETEKISEARQLLTGIQKSKTAA